MSDQPKGWVKLTGPARDALVQADDDGHYLREFALAKWARRTVFPQAIERWVREIGEKAEWK